MQFVTQCMYSVSVSFYNFYTCNLHHDIPFFISFDLTSGQTWRPLELCAGMVCLCVYVGMWYACMFTRMHGHAWTFCSCHRNARACVWPLIYLICFDILVCDVCVSLYNLFEIVQHIQHHPTLSGEVHGQITLCTWNRICMHVLFIVLPAREESISITNLLCKMTNASKRLIESHWNTGVVLEMAWNLSVLRNVKICQNAKTDLLILLNPLPHCPENSPALHCNHRSPWHFGDHSLRSPTFSSL